MAGVLAVLLVLCCGVVVAGVVVAQRFSAQSAGGDDDTETPRTGPIEWLMPDRGITEQNALWEELAEEFEAAQGEQVELRTLPAVEYDTMGTIRQYFDDPPDLFESSGGNRLRRQVEENLVRDLTDDLADVIATLPPVVLAPYTVDGRVYGLPYHLGPIGVWYNKARFAEAGLDPERPPESWGEFLDAVLALKDHDIIPVALGGRDGWPLLFWYGCLATRVAGVDAFVEAGRQRSLSANPDFLRAAELLVEFIEMEPFPPHHLTIGYADPGGQSDLMGQGEAAMELMGPWAPDLYATTGADELGDDLGWFPFPAVEGGKGSGADIYGHTYGFVVSRGAPDTTLDLLRHVLRDDSYERILAADPGLLSVWPGATGPVDDPHRQRLQAAIQEASAVQLLLDSELPPSVAAEMLDRTSELLAGAVGPEALLHQITESWQQATDY